jgi:hypothetical protein
VRQPGRAPRFRDGAPAGQGAGVRAPRAAAAMEAGTGVGDAAMELGVARRQNCGMPRHGGRQRGRGVNAGGGDEAKE